MGITFKLREHQARDVQKLRAAFALHRAVLYYLPTGGGKTVCASFIIDGVRRRGKRVWFLAHRQELIRQTSDTLTSLGVPHGIIAPQFTPSHDEVQVASVQTLARRLHRVAPPDFIIVDEAHHCIKTTTWGKVLDHCPGAYVLGLTATPVRLSGEGLGVMAGGIFEDMVRGPSVAELIAGGFLARPRVYAPPVGADLSSLRKKYGEFVGADVVAAMDKPVITGSAVEHYRKLAHGVPAIAFCASVAHAEHVADQFRAAGYRAASIDGSMKGTERKGKITALGNGGLQVLTSCDIISEGTDVPIVGAAILLRPTASVGLYLQQVGRALRMYPGKTEAIILDHVGNCMRHGLPDEDREWSLFGDSSRGKGKKKDDDDGDIKTRQCEQCYAVHVPAPKCPYCGYVYQAQAREIEQVAGNLVEIDAEQIERDRAAQFRRREEGRCNTLEDFQELARKRGYAPGWAHHRWKARERRTGTKGATQ